MSFAAMWATNALYSLCSCSGSTSTRSTLCNSQTTPARYPTFKGTILQGAELANLVEGLEANELLDGYTHMLTGYIGSSSFLRSVMGAYETLKAANPDMLFICDPVLGDEGRLYVPAENVDVYREEVLPLATMLTPNQFEAELLSGVKILTQEDAVRACMALHARGPDTVVITSNHLRDPEFRKDDIVLIASTRRRPRSLSRSRRANPEAAAPDDAAPASEEVDSDCSLDVVGGRDGNGSNLVDSAEKSRDDAQGPGGEKSVKEGGGKANDDVPRERSTVREPEVDVYRMTFPRLPQQFTGTGDLAAALLLAWTHRLPGDLSAALEKVAGTMRAVLKRTHAEGSAELLLIESKEDIERPPVEIKAVMIPIGPRR